MKNFARATRVTICIVSAMVLLCGFSQPVAAADINLDNTHYIVLTPGHSKTIAFDLDWGQVHTSVIHMIGLVTKVDKDGNPVDPTFKFSAAVTDSIGDNAELVFATTGFIGLVDHFLFAADETATQKISNSFFANYAYSSDAMSASRTIPVMPVSVGGVKGIIAAQAILVTGFVLPIGDPDFPVTMSMNFELN
jgi:hypothetical protein